VLAGFAGSAADAFALLERFEKKLSEFPDNTRRRPSSWPRNGGPIACYATRAMLAGLPDKSQSDHQWARRRHRAQRWVSPGPSFSFPAGFRWSDDREHSDLLLGFRLLRLVAVPYGAV